MPPYFETVTSFADVPITEDGVETKSFLDASDGLVNMFDLFGSRIFGFVQTDIRNNIAGVRRRYDAATERSSTLEILVRSESEEGTPGNGGACLVRLVRGLAFTCGALKNAQMDREAEMDVCFRRAYDVVLRHHHSRLVRSIVSLAIRAVPNRREFYERIRQGGSKEKLDEEMGRWVCGLEGIVERVGVVLKDGGVGCV